MFHFIKKKVDKVFYQLPLSKRISLESHPDFACNTFALYQYMLEMKLNETYKIYWFVTDPAEFSKEKVKNVYILNREPGNFFQLFRTKYILARSSALIFANRFMRRENEKQLLLFLQHGSPVKKLNGYCIGERCDYAVCQSDYMIDIIEREHQISRNKLVVLGSPRNDLLYQEKDALRERLFPELSQNKLLVWLPTFRQHQNQKEEIRQYNCEVTETGFPLLTKQDDFDNMNEILKKNHVTLLVKPHPAQRVDVLAEKQLSHIYFINDSWLAEHEVQLHQLLACTDGLLTDYSSIYFDYLLLNKPIGLIFDDVMEYQNKRGFIVDEIKDLLKGSYLYTKQDLEGFISNLSQGNDEACEERKKANQRYNKYQDDQSSKRVFEFLMEHMNC